VLTLKYSPPWCKTRPHRLCSRRLSPNYATSEFAQYIPQKMALIGLTSALTWMAWTLSSQSVPTTFPASILSSWRSSSAQ
jgi:hypothetical protein